MTMVPALGLLLSSEGAATCTCSYNFHTSLALVPAAERGNEDWAVFYDEPGNVLVQHAALNLGAPGDRADGSTVWLGVPRPMSKWNVPLRQRLDLPVPLNFVVREGFGAYRVNADRTPIAGTDRPWVYASGLRGLHRATLDMEYLTGEAAVALSAKRPPKIDGRRAESCWDGGRMVAVHGGRAAVLLRHDEDNLYVAYERPAVIDRRGVSKPWQVTEGDDSPVWEGDSFELYLSDSDAKKCLHLGVSASGARYDGLWGIYTNPVPSTGTATPPGVYREDSEYNAEWISAANADEDAFTAEVAVPWKALAAAGLEKDKLMIDLESRGELRTPPRRGRGYAPVVLSAGEKVPRRVFTVRLHFAELDGARTGERVFEVRLQGKRVLKQFDVVKAAGGANRAVVKEFKGVKAARAMTIELIPRAKQLTNKTAPIISGIEVIAE